MGQKLGDVIPNAVNPINQRVWGNQQQSSQAGGGSGASGGNNDVKWVDLKPSDKPGLFSAKIHDPSGQDEIIIIGEIVDRGRPNIEQYRDKDPARYEYYKKNEDKLPNDHAFNIVGWKKSLSPDSDSPDVNKVYPIDSATAPQVRLQSFTDGRVDQIEEIQPYNTFKAIREATWKSQGMDFIAKAMKEAFDGKDGKTWEIKSVGLLDSGPSIKDPTHPQSQSGFANEQSYIVSMECKETKETITLQVHKNSGQIFSVSLNESAGGPNHDPHGGRYYTCVAGFGATDPALNNIKDDNKKAEILKKKIGQYVQDAVDIDKQPGTQEEKQQRFVELRKKRAAESNAQSAADAAKSFIIGSADVTHVTGAPVPGMGGGIQLG